MKAAETKIKIYNLVNKKRLADALSLCVRLCKKTPRDTEAWLLAAQLNASVGRLDNVISCCKKVVQLEPGYVMAHYNLGVALQSLKKYGEAEKSYRAALRLDSSLVNAAINLGQVVLHLGRVEESVSIYRKLLNQHSHAEPLAKASANVNLSQALCQMGDYIGSEQACREALELGGRLSEAYNNLGHALKEQGRLEEAADAHRKAVEENSAFSVAHSNLLLDLNYLPAVSGNDIYHEHLRWGVMHADHLRVDTRFRGVPESGRRLRIGYFSPDFRAHSVVLFIAPLIAAHDRDAVEVFCYSNVSSPDAWTQKLQKMSDHWCDVTFLSDRVFAEKIISDRIDILIDLAGHTADNRLLVFARRPAPIQMTWLGYPNTTGMKSMDYRITDEWADPPGKSDDLHSEKLLRMPAGFLCFQPLEDSPDINELPAIEEGYITFGCFNNSAKISSSVIDLWSKILHELPSSRLILKSKQLTDPSLKERYLSTFRQSGIDSSRIEIYGKIKSTVEHLSLYHKVDIGLDPFPYNGTTTTCEALWMGVPVVVLAGELHAGRVGVSILTNVGLEDLVANTADEYIRICSDLGNDIDRLKSIREGMRIRLKGSALLDSQGFARNMEETYSRVWDSYCRHVRNDS